LVLTIPLPVLRIIARLCLQKYDEFIILQSSREQQGNIGNFKEKDNAFYQQPFAPSYPIFFLSPSVGYKDMVLYLLFNRYSPKWQLVTLLVWTNATLFLC